MLVRFETEGTQITVVRRCGLTQKEDQPLHLNLTVTCFGLFVGIAFDNRVLINRKADFRRETISETAHVSDERRSGWLDCSLAMG
jgi:hypothetical protein